MSRLVTELLGAIFEAGQELRIHRTRVLLSLIGVAVAVCSLTTVVALGAVVQQANVELSERSSGRPASLFVSASMLDGSTLDAATMDALWAETTARYEVRYASRVMSSSQLVPFADGVTPVGAQAVDQPYGDMHRVRILSGTWFAPGDEQRLAPPVVVSSVFWDRLGRPDLRTHPTVRLGGEKGALAVIIGVYPSSPWETEPSMYLLADDMNALAATAPAGQAADPYGSYLGAGGSTQYEMWVPPESAESLMAAVKRDLTAALGDGAQVDVNRQDAAQYGDDPFLVTKLVIGGIAVLVLLLGALGLVNIALVTVKQRVREIGIRRSFGATAGRVFFAVMMESVVATVVAGAVGVVAAILIVQSGPVRDLVGQGMITDFPPFPVDAAVLGLIAATAVGALAGLLPALVAVRVKVIDAIRY